MHPAHRLAEPEAPTSPGVVARGEILNAEAAEVAGLIPVITRQPFSAAVADAQADERVGCHGLDPCPESERSTAEPAHRFHMWTQAIPVRGSEECFALFALQQQQVEIDGCFFRAGALIAAVLADLPDKRLEKGPALLSASRFEQFGCSASATGTALAHRGS